MSEDAMGGGLPYRMNVGLVLMNRAGEIFIGKRIGYAAPEEGWQLPQGGIDDGEDVTQALWREMEEEIGTRKAEMVARYPQALGYDFPAQVQSTVYGGRFRGQMQHWFLLRFLGEERDINIHTPPGAAPEFAAYAWKTADDVARLAVPFKRKIYETVLTHFSAAIARARG